ncbi:hypothetical protein M3B39_005765 [Micrococcus luteus]|nr:hypothetical protein [Micrococcus luteus]
MTSGFSVINLFDSMKRAAKWRESAEYFRSNDWALEDIRRLDSNILQYPQRIRSILQQSNPLAMVRDLHAWDATIRQLESGASSFGSDAMIQIATEVLCSLDEESVRARLLKTIDLNDFLSLVEATRGLATDLFTKTFSGEYAGYSISEGSSSMILSHMRMERDLDRNMGYTLPLRRVLSTVFSKVDEGSYFSRSFKLLDSLAFMDTMQAELMKDSSTLGPIQMPEFLSGFTQLKEFTINSSKLESNRQGRIQFDGLHGEASSRYMSDKLGVDYDVFLELVRSMSILIGSTSGSPSVHGSTMRGTPIIRFSNNDWCWFRPLDFIHDALDWSYSVNSSDERDLKRYDRLRQRGAEILVESLIRDIFPNSRVFVNAKFRGPSKEGEVDVLVDLPGAVLIFEVKGGRLTPAGRRGAPDRVKKKVEEFVEKPKTQIASAADAIASGATFVDRSGRRVVLDRSSKILGFTVLLERVDPFSLLPPMTGPSFPGVPNLVIAATELATIADTLKSPEDFYAYFSHRHDFVSVGGLVYVESDALGAWFTDRNFGARSFSNPDGTERRVVMDSSEMMNDYYTYRDLEKWGRSGEVFSDQVSAPQTHVPAVVLQALNVVRCRGDCAWADLTERIYRVPISYWRKFNQAREAALDPNKKNVRVAKKWLGSSHRDTNFRGELESR